MNIKLKLSLVLFYLINKINKLKDKLLNIDTTVKECIETLESIMSRHFVTIVNNSEEYVSGHRSKRRLLYVFITKIMVLLYIIQVLLPGIINEVRNRIMLIFVL